MATASQFWRAVSKMVRFALHYPRDTMRTRRTTPLRMTASSVMRRRAATIQVVDSSGRFSSTYLDNVQLGDTVRFKTLAEMPGVRVEPETLGEVVEINADAPEIVVEVAVERSDALTKGFETEVVRAHPDDLELVVHSEDPRFD